MAQRWGRVVVGVDGSIASLAALRRAVEIARVQGAGLQAILVFGPEVAGHTTVGSSVPQDRGLVAQGDRRIDDAFSQALGGQPADVAITTAVRAYEGNAGAVLAGLADREEDLLVVGASRSGWPRRLLRRSVSRYCIREARCPVLVVPLPELARTVHRRWPHARRIPGWLAQSLPPGSHVPDER